MFRYIKKRTDKKTIQLTLAGFKKLIQDADVRKLSENCRKAIEAGDQEAYTRNKGLLPMVFWVGYNEDGTRLQANLKPTQFFIVDIDHTTTNPQEIWGKVRAEWNNAPESCKIFLVHRTPSYHNGIRFVVRATENFPSTVEHMDWFVKKFKLEEYGEYDRKVGDLSRGSFLPGMDNLLYCESKFFEDADDFCPIREGLTQYAEGNDEKGAKVPAKKDVSQLTYKGSRVTDILEKYIEVNGKPGEGEVHNYYNDLIKNFRNLVDNDAETLFNLLPRFGHGAAECWSQCKSITRLNTTSSLPRKFWLFLYHEGFIKTKNENTAQLDAEPEKELTFPRLPPVFREFAEVAPDGFKLPVINALMPVLGTLSSYLRSHYMDGSEQSTSFYTCIYAPPGTGKSFCSRVIDRLFEILYRRDELSNLREEIFLTEKAGKSQSEKDPIDPHVSVRILPAINSQPEFLQKMKDNKGFHMFTFAEEVDTFNKGTRSGGGDKSDLFRIAWDNGRYGQSFKAANTFKGMVRLYYNVLLTGTPNQVLKYYNNVENGMVTRVCFCEIKDQQFSEIPIWKMLNKRQCETINRVINRCDEMTYKEPLKFDFDLLQEISNKEFDANVPWRYSFRPFTEVQLDWIFPALKKWLNRVRKESSLEMNYAKDTFSHRTALKGFRLALLCHCLYDRIDERAKKVITEFVLWWMDTDLDESMALFAEKYNQTQNDTFDMKTLRHKNLFEALDKKFTKSDVIAACLKLQIKSKVKSIIHRWKKEGAIEKIDETTFQKSGNGTKA